LTGRVYFYTDPTSGGSIGVNGVGTFTNGQYADLETYYEILYHIPSGYQFSHWSTTGGVSVGGMPCGWDQWHYCNMTVTGDGSVTAHFTLIPPVITVNTSPGGLDSPYGGGTYEIGQTAYIGVSSVGGYTFLHWTKDGSIHTYNQTFSFLVDASHTFTAVFQAQQAIITVNTSPGGLDAPSGGGTYTVGQSASIGVSSVTGYTFQYWLRDGVLHTYNQSFSYTVDANRTFTAVFQIQSFAITVNTSPGGLDAPSGAGTYNYGANAPISVSSVSGYRFDHWNRDGALYTYSQSFGYSVDAARTFTAVFVLQYAITVATSPPSLDSPYGAGSYDSGATANIGVSSVYGYTFQKWNRDGVFYTASQTFPYTVDAARTFTAVFIPIQYSISVATSPGGLNAPSGAGTYDYGTSINISVSNVLGYTFVQWNRDGIFHTFNQSFSYLVDAARMFTAIFKGKQYKIDAALRKLGITKTIETDVVLKDVGIAEAHSIDDALKALGVWVTKNNDVRIRPALGVAKDVYLYPGLYPTFLNLGQTHIIDAWLKVYGLSTVHGISCSISDVSVMIRKFLADLALKKLDTEEALDVAAGLQREDVAASGIDAFLVRGMKEMHLIDALLRKPDEIVRHEIDAALERIDQERGHAIDSLVVHPYPAPHVLDAIITKVSKRNYGVGVYLVSPQKFTLTLSFIQFEVECSFEAFEVEPSFEQFHVTPYFQET
jgi:hypothetical protein